MRFADYARRALELLGVEDPPPGSVTWEAALDEFRGTEEYIWNLRHLLIETAKTRALLPEEVVNFEVVRESFRRSQLAFRAHFAPYSSEEIPIPAKMPELPSWARWGLAPPEPALPPSGATSFGRLAVPRGSGRFPRLDDQVYGFHGLRGGDFGFVIEPATAAVIISLAVLITVAIAAYVISSDSLVGPVAPEDLRMIRVSRSQGEVLLAQMEQNTRIAELRQAAVDGGATPEEAAVLHPLPEQIRPDDLGGRPTWGDSLAKSVRALGWTAVAAGGVYVGVQLYRASRSGKSA